MTRLDGTRLSRLETWRRRDVWREQGLCVDCGDPVVKRLDGTESLRCGFHLKKNNGKHHSVGGTDRNGLVAEDLTGGHLDQQSFFDYRERVLAAVIACGGDLANDAECQGASLRAIHEHLGAYTRRDWTLDAIRTLKTDRRICEGSSILVSRYFALDTAADAEAGDPAAQDDDDSTTPDDYDELLRYAQQSHHAEVAYA